jgi:type VI secretion system protein ImpB
MPNESIHEKLKRVRRPRVHITYDVQVGDAIEKRELPLVVGVMADLSGDRDPNNPPKKLKDRKFVKIDRDEFDQVMAKIEPRLEMSVKNVLQNDDTNIGAVLKFKRLSDFNPDSVAKQVPALNQLLELRTKLANLRSSLYGKDRLEELLNEVVAKTEAAGGKESAGEKKEA